MSVSQTKCIVTIVIPNILFYFQMSGVGLGVGEEGRKSETSLHDSDPGRLDQLIYGKVIKSF